MKKATESIELLQASLPSHIKYDEAPSTTLENISDNEDLECQRTKGYLKVGKDLKSSPNLTGDIEEQYFFIGPFKITCLSEDFLLSIDRYEIANAVSMIVPAAVSYALIYFFPFLADRYTLALAWAPVIHFPFSFSYHLYLALPQYQESWALLCHRLDSGLIHLVSSLYAYGTSRSLVYGLLSLPCNAIPTILLWYSDSRVPNTNMMTISVIIYLLPMLWYHSLIAFILTGAAFFITAQVWEK
mmetsp:Transcript_12819/g.16527  ORF Transcript_12819/g.16527 Transcript_12819/m.16527 type:complete len:243 (+) Transcript_12819:50-778(+)